MDKSTNLYQNNNTLNLNELLINQNLFANIIRRFVDSFLVFASKIS
jgi:hypothetical protein